MSVRVGISGWVYAGWRGHFYPPGLKPAEVLPLLQRPEHFRQWHAVTPEGFVFAVKGGRYVTHMLKLRQVETALANFFASGVLLLEEKFGPILWQLSPRFLFEQERLEAFLSLLPRDTAAAARLAAQHDHKVAGRAEFSLETARPLRHAIEIRHRSFCRPEFVALLRARQVALVFADSVAWPIMRTSPPTSFICGCTAGPSSMPAVMTTRRCFSR